MIIKSKQAWTVGGTVKVGFMSGLLVVAAVATPGDFAPDAYVLTRNDQFYSFVPHNGISKISAEEARDMVMTYKEQANRAAADAIAKAQRSAAHADLVADLVAA